jgi:hypothetical protein
LHINMPILDAAYNIIYNNASAKLEVEKLTEKLV